MKNKNILITGSSYGIGFEIAKNLAGSVNNLIITSRNKKKLINSKKKIGSKNCFVQTCDFEKNQSVNNLMRKIKKKFNKIDVIICNVGSGKTCKTGNENREVWQKTFDKNFFSTTNVIENYIRIFKNKKYLTKIIVIGSIAGNFKGNAPLSYSLAKNCLINYVHQISPFLANKNILINSVSPGHVLLKGNNWHKKLLKSRTKILKMVDKSISLKRFCKVEDVNNYINFLISDGSNYITGTNIEIDGKTK